MRIFIRLSHSILRLVVKWIFGVEKTGYSDFFLA
jgi:hypothetical protein